MICQRKSWSETTSKRRKDKTAENKNMKKTFLSFWFEFNPEYRIIYPFNWFWNGFCTKNCWEEESIVKSDRLTSDDHHTGGEYLFVVRFGGHVAETDAGHTRHGEVECRDVHGLASRPVDQLRRIAVIRPNVGVGRLGDVGQFPQPTVLDAIVSVRTADRVPNAGQPMGHQHVKA